MPHRYGDSPVITQCCLSPGRSKCHSCLYSGQLILL